MEAAAYRAAKMQVVEQMLQGQPWHEAVAAAELQISRSTAYHILKRVRNEGEAALTDGRHGHPTKLRPPVRQWLKGYWQDRPGATCQEAQVALEGHFGVRVSQSHLSRVRTALGVTSHREARGEKRRRPRCPLSQSGRREREVCCCSRRPRRRGCLRRWNAPCR